MRADLLAALIVEQACSDIRSGLLWLLKNGYDISDTDKLVNDVSTELESYRNKEKTYEMDKRIRHLRYVMSQLNKVNEVKTFFRGDWFQYLLSIVGREVSGEEVIHAQERIALSAYERGSGLPKKGSHDNYIIERRGRNAKNNVEQRKRDD